MSKITLRKPRSSSVESRHEERAARIRRYHEMGRQIATRVAEGATIDKAITEEGHSETRSTAYKAHQFARMVRSEVELNRYIGAAEHGNFGWTHIQALLLVRKQRDRLRFLGDTVANRWTPSRLRREITQQSDFPPADRPHRGPRFRKATSLPEVQKELVELLRPPFSFLTYLLTDDSPFASTLSSKQKAQLARLRETIEEIAELTQ